MTSRTSAAAGLPVVAVLAGLALIALVGLLPYAANLLVRVPLNYNEGWGAFRALDALAGRNPYTPDGYATYANYPPVSFYLVGALGTVVGDHIFAGRLLSSAGLLLTAFGVGVITRRIGGDVPSAVLASLIVVIHAAANYPAYVGTADPQWFAHAIQVTGLAILLRHRDASLPRLAAAVVFIAGAGLVKHNLIAMPLAISIWLALANQKQFARWLVLSLAAVAAGSAAVYLVFGSDAFVQILGHRRVHALETALTTARTLVWYLPLVAIAACSWSANRTNPRVSLLAAYAVAAVVVGLAFVTGEGVSINVFFDVLIASAPLAALAAMSLARRLRMPLAAALLIVAIPSLTIMAIRGVRNPTPHSVEVAPAWAAAIDTIARTEGAVICEDLAACYWAGRRSAVDMFNAGQEFFLDMDDSAAFGRLLAERRYQLVELSEPTTFRLPPELNRLVQDNYATTSSRSPYLYTPEP